MRPDFHLTVREAATQLKIENKNPFAVLMRHSSMSVEYYSPVEKDLQLPHRLDEIYVVASSSGIFFRD